MQPDLPEALEDALYTVLLDFPENQHAARIAALCNEHPAHAESIRSVAAEVASGQDLVGALSLDEPGDTGVPERLGDFRLVRQLGGGGMGIVFEAVQESLGRTVALKVVRPEQVFFDKSRRRFRREVESVSRLRHPGIVAVLAVGEERGVPFYAMELVSGCSLHQVLEEVGSGAVDRLDGRDLERAVRARTPGLIGDAGPGAPLFDGTWNDVAVRIVQQAALALHHAHTHGIVHRDVKPSNVMVTVDGRVQLIDFGLAHVDEPEVLTRTGGVLGSLAYMAPEQLRGETADARTDVYALGVTLFELLTLQRPFGAERSEILAASITEGLPPRVRKLSRSVSRDLEAVCLTAMDRRPARRYADAERLADDLGRILGGRPVTARPVGPIDRGLRYAACHPARVGVLALCVVAPTVLWWQQRGANTRIAAERDRASYAFERASDALRDAMVELAGNDLVSVPQAIGVRLRLCERAVALYDDLLERERSDAMLRGAVRARLELGSVLVQIGELEPAGHALDGALALIDEVTASGASPRDLLYAAAACQSLAVKLSEEGRWDDAESILQSAATFLRRSADEFGPQPAQSERLSIVLQSLTSVRMNGEDPDGARAAAREAVLWAERAVDGHEDPPAAALAVAKARLMLAFMEGGDQGASTLREAIERLDPLIRDRQGHQLHAQMRATLGRAETALAMLLHDSDPASTDSLDAITRAVEVFEALVEDFSGAWFERRALTQAVTFRARILRDLGRFDEALAGWQRGAALLRETLALRPNDPVAGTQLVDALEAWGRCAADNGPLGEALDVAEELERAAGAIPERAVEAVRIAARAAARAASDPGPRARARALLDRAVAAGVLRDADVAAEPELARLR